MFRRRVVRCGTPVAREQFALSGHLLPLRQQRPNRQSVDPDALKRLAADRRIERSARAQAEAEDLLEA